MGFGPGDVCGGPLLALQFTSARVQSRFEFVEVGGDTCSKCQGEVQAETPISG